MFEQSRSFQRRSQILQMENDRNFTPSPQKGTTVSLKKEVGSPKKGKNCRVEANVKQLGFLPKNANEDKTLWLYSKTVHRKVTTEL